MITGGRCAGKEQAKSRRREGKDSKEQLFAKSVSPVAHVSPVNRVAEPYARRAPKSAQECRAAPNSTERYQKAAPRSTERSSGEKAARKNTEEHPRIPKITGEYWRAPKSTQKNHGSLCKEKQRATKCAALSGNGAPIIRIHPKVGVNR